MFKRWWWVFLAMAFIGPVIGFGVAAGLARLVPRQYESTAVIQVRPRDSVEQLRACAGPDSREPGGCGVEFDVIRSRDSLGKVIQRLDLQTKWGRDSESMLTMLKKRIEVRNIPGTDLIAIKVRDTSPEEARDIAAEVAKVYSEWRTEAEKRYVERWLGELKKAVREQEDKVAEKRKLLAEIVKSHKIVYQEKMENDGNRPMDGRGTGEAYLKLEQEKTCIENQLDGLGRFEGDQLLVYASGLDLPDNKIRTLCPEYLEKKRTLERIKGTGLDDRHPLVVETVRDIEKTRKDLDEGIAGLRDALRSKLALAKSRLEKADALRNSKSAEEIKAGLDAVDFVEAKKEYETVQDMLQQMRMKLLGEQIQGKIQVDPVVINEDPQIPRFSAGPNVVLLLVTGTIAGFLLSPLMALPVIALLR